MQVDHRTSAYDPGKERTWHVSALLTPETYAWCVHDIGTGSCVALLSGKPAELPGMGSLPRHPSSVSFTALPEISTLVPESALAPGSEMAHLRTVHGHVPTGLLRDEPIGTLGARCVYLHDEEAEHRLMTRFPSARSLSLQVVLVQTALARSAKGPVLLLHRSAKRLDLALADRQRLLLSNTFHAVNAEDVLYYTLFVLERNGLKPADTHVLTGGTHLHASEEELLARYLPDVAPCIPKDHASLRGTGIENPAHWAGLLLQFACA